MKRWHYLACSLSLVLSVCPLALMAGYFRITDAWRARVLGFVVAVFACGWLHTTLEVTENATITAVTSVPFLAVLVWSLAAFGISEAGSARWMWHRSRSGMFGRSRSAVVGALALGMYYGVFAASLVNAIHLLIPGAGGDRGDGAGIPLPFWSATSVSAGGGIYWTPLLLNLAAGAFVGLLFAAAIRLLNRGRRRARGDPGGGLTGSGFT